MINLKKINQLAAILPINTHLPSNLITHELAFSDHAIKLLSSDLEIHNHIAFIVIQPEHSYLLTNKLIQSVHCVIIKGVGVFLSSTCSFNTECILEQLVKWAPYKKVSDNMELYQR